MKYRLTDETKTTECGVLRRIFALRDIPSHGVRKGDLGGWVENESNLDQDGDAWIGGDAWVVRKAKVCDNAWVYGNAKVGGDAWVDGDAWICDNAVVYESAKVGENTRISGKAVVGRSAWVYGNAWVCGNAVVGGCARICGNAKVGESAWVSGNAVVGGCARICGNAKVCGDAKVSVTEDYVVFKNFWSSGRWFTYTRSNRMWKVGCFYGTGEELIKKAYGDSDTSGRCYEATVKYVEAIESAIAKEGGAK